MTVEPCGSLVSALKASLGQTAGICGLSLFRGDRLPAGSSLDRFGAGATGGVGFIRGSLSTRTTNDRRSISRTNNLQRRVTSIVTIGCWIAPLAIALNSVFVASNLAKQIRSKDRQSTKDRSRRPAHRPLASQSTIFGRGRLTQPAQESGMRFCWGS